MAETLAALRRKGFGRLYVDGQAISLEDVDPRGAARSADAAGHRRSAEGGRRSAARLTDSIETAYAEGGGAAFAIALDPATVVHRFSERFECRTCNIPYEVPQPRLFSFNNPFGACPICHGFGNVIELDMDLVVPDQSKSIQQNAVEPWSKPHYRAQLAELKRAAQGARADGRAVVVADRRGTALRDRGGRRRASKASRVSSAGWNARSTRSTSGCSSAAIAAI